MREELDKLLQLLPHQYPLRLVDRVLRYDPGNRLIAAFSAAPLAPYFTPRTTIPQTILLEGLAQAAVILVQLETASLKKGEIPLLGRVHAEIVGEAKWEERIRYEVRPERMLSRQASVAARVFNEAGVQVAHATLYMAVGN